MDALGDVLRWNTDQSKKNLCYNLPVKSYLFVLGRNPILSRAELGNFCDELLFDEEKSLLLAENLKFENPRKIPRAPEQLFLDRLGGTIRFGEVLGEFKSEIEVQQKILHTAQNDKSEGKINLGVSAWGCGRTFLRHFLPEVKNAFREKLNRNCRIVNAPGENLDSGKIFGEKLLRNGFEFLVWKRGNSFLLAKTVANQNLRNYTLRDREKNFRDSKMGMLPPKLAQILINLADPAWDEMVIDPFCGSGTVNIEAAIMGFRTMGSDLKPGRAQEAQKNFEQMAEKFRYETVAGKFFTSDATKFFPGHPEPRSLRDKLREGSQVIVTEGILGPNPNTGGQQTAHFNITHYNITPILILWEKFFAQLEKTSVRRVAFCLPAWPVGKDVISLSGELFAKIKKTSYTPRVLFGEQKTFLYARPDAFVAREICVVEKK